MAEGLAKRFEAVKQLFYDDNVLGAYRALSELEAGCTETER
jgi:hypothetical protein